jgi:CubicO group peptidase (beta-lactamase class C family)
VHGGEHPAGIRLWYTIGLQPIKRGGTAVAHPQGISTQNWNQAPYNRWSFQYIQSLFPTCRLPRGGVPARDFGEAYQDLSAIIYPRSNGETGTVGQMIADSFTDSFLVVKSGSIVSEQYFNGMSADSHHLLNSVTKSFVGMLAGIAVQRKLLDPEALVTSLLPGLDNSAWEGATVRHLLDMTAGANYGEDYTDPAADFWQEAAVVGWRPDLVTASSPGTLYEYARTLRGKDQQNGEKFHYRTVTTNVIGLILEEAMGRPLGELLTDELWSRMAPRNDANVVVDKSGSLYVGAGMSACTRDLAAFGCLMIGDGQIGGEQVLPAEWIQDTMAGDPTSRQCYLDSEYAVFGFSHYRNQVWVKDSAREHMLALGIHGQIIYMNKSADVVIVKLSTQPEQVNMEMFVDAFAAMDAIAATLT